MKSCLVTRSPQQDNANFTTIDYAGRSVHRPLERVGITRTDNKSGLLAVRVAIAYTVLATAPEAIVIVPLLIPRLFCTAFELAGAIYDGEVLVDARRVSKIRGMLISFYDADPGPYELALATVATDVFSDENTRACFLERVDAFDRLLGNKGLIEAWGETGWVRRNAIDADRFAPARFVVEAAAICALDTRRRAFDLQDFHQAAYKRAAARGVEFW